MADAQGPGDRIYERLNSLLLSTADLGRFLAELAEVSTTVVAAPVSTGITVRHEGSLITVGSSDARAELLDESQYRNGGGPCLDGLRTGRVVDVRDARDDQRWPGYMATALDAGLRCSLSLPLSADGTTFGAMNVYGFDRPHLFDDDDIRHRLELFAAQATGTLRVGLRMVKDSTLLDQMERALHTRTVIDQALGILMAQQRCTATEAFDLLRSQSQRTHRRLHELATELVAEISGRPPEPGKTFDQG